MKSNEDVFKKSYLRKKSSYFERERQEILQYIPEDAHIILEVGCGAGHFGQILKTKGNLEVWGVELIEDMRYLQFVVIARPKSS